MYEGLAVMYLAYGAANSNGREVAKIITNDFHKDNNHIIQLLQNYTSAENLNVQ